MTTLASSLHFLCVKTLLNARGLPAYSHQAAALFVDRISGIYVVRSVPINQFDGQAHGIEITGQVKHKNGLNCHHLQTQNQQVSPTVPG
jgi:hypothetical protein